MAELEATLTSVGYTAAGSVTKRTRLVIAADPHSQSGKTQRARRYGIPVLSLADGFALLGIEL